MEKMNRTSEKRRYNVTMLPLRKDITCKCIISFIIKNLKKKLSRSGLNELEGFLLLIFYNSF